MVSGRMRWEKRARTARFHANMPSGSERHPGGWTVKHRPDGDDPRALSGTCPLCPSPIIVGDYVMWWSRDKRQVVHSECYNAQRGKT